MSHLTPIDYTTPDASQRFVESLYHTGFGVLKNHPLCIDEVQLIYQQWHTFFQSDEKERYQYNPEKMDGFFSTQISETAKGHKTRDIKEYYHYYPWGRCPPQLKDITHRYYESTKLFAQKLLGWIEEHSPKEVRERYSIPLSQMHSDNTLLRILHYPPLPEERKPDALRAAAHEDINLITILPASNEPGLQVKTKDGEWLPIPCDFGNLIVNIGDMLQEASGRYFPSTSHRVINPEGMDKRKSRISLPLFLHPNSDVVLSDQYTAGSYLEERLKELGVKASSAGQDS